MRIATTQIYQDSTAQILNQQANLNKTQVQLGSGKKIVSPADDPAAASEVIARQSQIDKLQQYQKNADAATLRLTIEDVTLSEVDQQLNRALQLLIQANNDTTTPQDRQAIALELSQITDAITGLVNTKDTNGEYIFSGYHSDKAPYPDRQYVDRAPYKGDRQEREVDVYASVSSTMTDAGKDIFQSDTMKTVITTLNRATEALEQGGDGQSFHRGMLEAQDEIKTASDNIAKARSEIGGKINATQAVRGVNGSFLLNEQRQISRLQDLDFAEASTRLNLQQTSLNAAQYAFVRVANMSLFNVLTGAR